MRERARISQLAPDDPERIRRLAAIHADLDLKATGRACPGCGERAWLAGGRGCACPKSDDLVARCLANANPRRTL